MLKNIFGKFSKDMGIDLGTTNTLVYVRGKGIIINQPSVVAIHTRSEQIIAVGENARRMLGKTPAHITVTQPLQHGIISDFEVSEKMLKHFIERVHRDTYTFLPRPRMVIGIPMDVTEVERKAVEDASIGAGAREVYMVEEPLAVAIGARLPVHEATGNLIVDLGGGTTEIAVLSLSGIVTKKTLQIAGGELNHYIENYVREHFNMLIGEPTAEHIKMKIGTVAADEKRLEYKMQGRDVLTGLPKEMVITSDHVREAIKRPIKTIVESIRTTIEATPPELVADIYKRGILLSGGTSLLRGINRVIADDTRIPVRTIDDPLTAVVRGTGIILEDLPLFKDILLPSTH